MGIATGTGLALAAGATIVSGAMGARAARKAGEAQAGAADRATEIQMAQYEQNREDLKPWREAGEVSLKDIMAGLQTGGDFNRDFTAQDFTADPGYQWRLRQGADAIEGSALSRGSLLSGGTLKALTRYGQDYGSNEYKSVYDRWNADRDRRFGRLATVAGIGQTATTQTAQDGSNTAQSVGNNMIGAGNARASAYMGSANAVGGAIAGATNNYSSNLMLRDLIQSRNAPATASPVVG